ncbi:MAG: hypothetical protein HQ538_04085 [Parcubacteria group bacterium]|nr:hypothetical protein [Parcubacteria group bacterium]
MIQDILKTKIETKAAFTTNPKILLSLSIAYAFMVINTGLIALFKTDNVLEGIVLTSSVFLIGLYVFNRLLRMIFRMAYFIRLSLNPKRIVEHESKESHKIDIDKIKVNNHANFEVKRNKATQDLLVIKIVVGTILTIAVSKINLAVGVLAFWISIFFIRSTFQLFLIDFNNLRRNSGRDFIKRI